MLIDAQRRFATRTAQWLLTSKLTKPEIAHRLGLFNENHVNLIHEQVKRLRGKQ